MMATSKGCTRSPRTRAYLTPRERDEPLAVLRYALRPRYAPGVDEDTPHARFAPGQIVHHLRFDYRGVVADVDAEFSLGEEWYERNAVSRPPRDRPWYHVLVDGSDAVTYVAERNLEADPSAEPVAHVAPSTRMSVIEDTGTWVLLAIRSDDGLKLGWTTRHSVMVLP